MPDASVVTVAPETVPPPLTTVNVTGAPAIGAPFWSFTITEGAGVAAPPAAPVIDVAEFAAIVVATEGSGWVVSPLQPMQATTRIATAARAIGLSTSVTCRLAVSSEAHRHPILSQTQHC
jgi:hypothetical protein